MKFVVLALCVCAASAATFNQNVGFGTWPKPGFAKATAQVSGPSEVVIGKTSFAKPVVQAYAKSVATPYRPPVAKAVVTPVVTPFAKTVVQPTVHATAQASTGTGPVFKSVKVEDNDGSATALRWDSEVQPDSFNYAYETSNGIAAASTGTYKKVDNVDTWTVNGQYQYISPEGVPIQLSYVADEHGYQPRSDILPVGPPVPIAIARSLEYIAAHAKTTKN